MTTGPASRMNDSATVVSAPDQTHQYLPARRMSAYTPTMNRPTRTAKIAVDSAAWLRKSASGWLVRP